MQLWPHVVGAIRFEDRFCTSEKGGMGEVGGFQCGVPCTWQLPWLAVEKRGWHPVGHFSPF